MSTERIAGAVGLKPWRVEWRSGSKKVRLSIGPRANIRLTPDEADLLAQSLRLMASTARTNAGRYFDGEPANRLWRYGAPGDAVESSSERILGGGA